MREARPGDVVVLAAPPSGAVFSPTAARIAAAGVSVVVLTGPHGSGAFATDARLGLEVVGRRG